MKEWPPAWKLFTPVGVVLSFFASGFLGDLTRRLTAEISWLKSILNTGPKLSPSWIKVLIVAEDRRFFLHPGFDPIGIARAAFRLAWYRRVEGASTIEQQLVRTALRRYQPSLSRKITEVLLASWLARRSEKLETAEMYLRVAYFGWRMNGILEACDRFGINVEKPTTEQCCFIIAALKYPLPQFPADPRLAAVERRAKIIWRALIEAEE